MNRIRIAMPAEFSFSTVITVRVTDLNYGNHVGNDSFLSLLHEARMQFLLSHGYTEIDLEGTSLIMGDVAIEFKKELHYADQVRISIAAEGFNKFGFDLLYKMEIVNGTETVLAGKAKTGMLCFDYTQKKLTGVPEKVKEKLTKK